jgi:integrase
MKFHERQLVEDTTPRVFIGRRIYKDRHGRQQISPNWYGECHHRGKDRFAALKTRSHSIALHRAHQFAETLRDSQDAMPARRMIGIADLARMYLEMQINRNRAPKTIEKYEYVLSTFVAWAQRNFNRPAPEFTEQLFWNWHKSMIDDGFSAKTRADRAVVVKQLFKWATKHKHISSNPIADAIVPDPPTTPQPCFDPDQVASLLANADAQLRAIFAVMAYAGLRFGEVRDLLWSDLQMPTRAIGLTSGSGQIIVQRGGSGLTTKSRKIRRVPLHPELRTILETVPRLGERVFYARPSKRYPDGGHPISQSHLLLSLKRLCKRCGFADWKTYKVHSLRHSFASMLARAGVPERYALQFMGHQRSNVLALYIQIFDDAAEQAIGAIRYPMPGSAGLPKAMEQSNRESSGGQTPGVPVAPTYMRIAR